MTTPSHRVIAHHVDKSIKVYPTTPKALSKKEAQRLASCLIAEEPAEVCQKVIMTEVVDVVQVAHVA